MVENWACGEINAYFAWCNSCTIENLSHQQRIRRALKNNGFIAHFGRMILNIQKQVNIQK